MFIGRTHELNLIRGALGDRTKAQLIVIYGRRRIGQSTLIRKAVKDEGRVLYFFREHYKACIEEKLREGPEERDPVWTESLALGSERYIAEVASHVKNRRRLETEPHPEHAAGTWVLQESHPAYV